jgi:hypothetical protein
MRKLRHREVDGPTARNQGEVCPSLTSLLLGLTYCTLLLLRVRFQESVRAQDWG